VPHLPSLASLFIYSSPGECPSPFSGGAFHTQPLLHAVPIPRLLGGGLPLLSSLAGLFICSSHEGVPLPHSPELRAPRPLCYVSFFFQLLAYYSVCFFFFFPWVGGQFVQGVMLICPREYHMPLICSPGGLHLLSRFGAGIWQHESLPGFSV
jgi:hypothetical protein